MIDSVEKDAFLEKKNNNLRVDATLAALYSPPLRPHPP